MLKMSLLSIAPTSERLSPRNECVLKFDPDPREQLIVTTAPPQAGHAFIRRHRPALIVPAGHRAASR